METDMVVKDERQSLEVETRLFSETDRLVDYIASTRSVDAYNTRLLEWNEKSLDQYRKNPVVLYMHNPTMPPIGRTIALDFDKESNMRARIQYAPKSVYKFADTIYQLTRHQYLKGLSVGFGKQKVERNDELKCLDYTDIHLRELSTVPLPGNADSLATAIRSGVIPKEHQQLMAINYAMSADHIDGVDDLSKLGNEVVEWMNDYDSSLSRSFETEPEVEEPKREDPIVVRQDTITGSDVTINVAPAVEEESPVRAASVTALDTIAGIVGFDMDDLATVEGVKRLCVAVQGACTRPGAALSRTSITKLSDAIDALVGLRDVAVSGNEPEPAVEEEIVEDTPDEDRFVKIEGDLALIAKALSTKGRVDSARTLIEGASKDDEPADDKNSAYLEQILQRVSGR